MPAREINPFNALTRIRSQFLRTQWSTSNHQRVDTTTPQTAQSSGLATFMVNLLQILSFHYIIMVWWRWSCIMHIYNIVTQKRTMEFSISVHCWRSCHDQNTCISDYGKTKKWRLALFVHSRRLFQEGWAWWVLSGYYFILPTWLSEIQERLCVLSHDHGCSDKLFDASLDNENYNKAPLVHWYYNGSFMTWYN